MANCPTDFSRDGFVAGQQHDRDGTCNTQIHDVFVFASGIYASIESIVYSFMYVCIYVTIFMYMHVMIKYCVYIYIHIHVCASYQFS